MLRFLLLLVAVAALVAVGAGDAWAQPGSDWPSFQPDPAPGSDFRGPGFYLSWVKILAAWLVFLAWVASTDWVNRDAQELKLKYRVWNPIVFGSFMAAFVLLWLIPLFWVGFPLLILTYLGSFIAYVIYRNDQVEGHQKVFTSAHLRFWLSERLSKFGVKIEAEKPDVHTKGPGVILTGRGGENDQVNNARTLASRQAPGLLAARELVDDALANRSSHAMLDYAAQAVAIRYMVDGVWHNRENGEREELDPALEALKILCGLKPEDRQSRQTGKFAAARGELKFNGTLTSQAVKTGERVLIQFEDERVRFDTLDDLGMRAKQQEQLTELWQKEGGLLLFSAIPAAGLRSTMKVVLHEMDRLTREFAAVEDEANPYEPIENVHVTTYKAADGQSPADVLTKLIRTDPNVLVVRDLVNGQTVDMLCAEIPEGRLIISTVRAKDCAEALLRVLALGASPKPFAQGVVGVVNQRLIRKLCDACKEAYAPTPQILKQLGIPEGRIQALYRPPQQPEEVCPECQGVGYLGRTSIFEILTVGDTVRRVLAGQPKLDLLRSAARKDGMRSLQEEGILLVAKGVTSLPELMRVMKQ